jgi:hypothetical protein
MVIRMTKSEAAYQQGIIPESTVKQAVEERLQLAMNQGKLYYERRNSGALVVESNGAGRRLIRLGKAGTADFCFFQLQPIPPFTVCRVVFIEVKRPVGGKQSDDQKAFQALVEAQGAEYYLVTDADELERYIV